MDKRKKEILLDILYKGLKAIVVLVAVYFVLGLLS